MISSRMQKRLVELAKRLISKKDGDYETRGIACRWLKISESWGVKFTDYAGHYLSEVFKNQRRAWRLNFAPFCFGFFKISLANGYEFYGYITQVATIAATILERKYGKHWYMNSKEDIIYKKLKKIRKLVQAKLGLIPCDLHEDNYGLIGNALVIIDWGFDGET